MEGHEPIDIEPLLKALSTVGREAWPPVDRDAVALGLFVRRHAGPPGAAERRSGSRSSIREDTVIQHLSDLLAEPGIDRVTVLDACCGNAILARRIAESIGDQLDRVAFWALDRHSAYIDSIRAEEDDFGQFASFTPMLRHVWDLEDLDDQMDLIVLNNSLHEIAPADYGRVFSSFNAHLRPGHGSICVVDMEALPDDQPEAMAITWLGSEVRQFLRAGGFGARLTTHPKEKRVYVVRAEQIAGPVNQQAMRTEIEMLLRSKLAQTVRLRRRLSPSLTPDAPARAFRQWLVLTATIARLAEELESPLGQARARGPEG